MEQLAAEFDDLPNATEIIEILAAPMRHAGANVAHILRGGLISIAGGVASPLPEHDPEKWKPGFPGTNAKRLLRDHAQTIN
jgi:hypothetical protein